MVISKISLDLVSVVTFASHLTHIIIALPVENLARVMKYALLLHKNKGKCYIKKQKRDTASTKDDELDLLGDDVDSFTGSHADHESAADNLFTSPPRPQAQPFSSLCIKTPAKTVPLTQVLPHSRKLNEIFKKSLGNTLNIHLQQQMGSFQASMLEDFQSLRDELTTKKQAQVDQTLASASKPGPSTSAVYLDLPPLRPRTTSHVEEMEVDYGPALPPHLGSDLHNASDQNSSASEEPSKKALDRPTMMNPMNLGFHLLNPNNMLTRVDIRSGQDTCHLPQRRISPLQPDTGLHSPLGLSPLGLSKTKTNLNIIQTPLITGQKLCLTFPANTLKRWTPSGKFFHSLTPGSLFLGPQLQLWVWMMKKAIESSDLEVLPLCYRSAQLSKMLLISLNMIFRPLIYLRVNTSNLLLSLQSGTRWDSPVMRRKYKS